MPARMASHEAQTTAAPCPGQHQDRPRLLPNSLPREALGLPGLLTHPRPCLLAQIACTHPYPMCIQRDPACQHVVRTITSAPTPGRLWPSAQHYANSQHHVQPCLAREHVPCSCPWLALLVNLHGPCDSAPRTSPADQHVRLLLHTHDMPTPSHGLSPSHRRPRPARQPAALVTPRPSQQPCSSTPRRKPTCNSSKPCSHLHAPCLYSPMQNQPSQLQPLTLASRTTSPCPAVQVTTMVPCTWAQRHALHNPFPMLHQLGDHRLAARQPASTRQRRAHTLPPTLSLFHPNPWL